MQTYRPLAGVKVLSFELAFSLPAGTRALHDLGAEVVRVSPPERHQDRYISQIDGVFHGKPCIAIDLTLAGGREVALDLALQADVVCNNFRPQVMGKYGLDAERLRKKKPELITLQLSGYGTPGPWANYPAFGPSTEAAGGLNWLMAGPGEIPGRLQTGVFADQLSGRHAALAIVAALKKRQTSGEGATIDLSMASCITHLLGEAMTKYSLTGKLPEPGVNRDPRFVPQGIYRAAGNDEWISLSVTDDEAWRRLILLLEDPALDPDLDLDPKWDRETRRGHHDSIDAAIENWTRHQDKNSLADQLQAIGIAAAPVRTVADSALDPQMLSRGALQPVRHKEARLGYLQHPHPPLPWRIANRRRRWLTDYRHTGQDNRRVLKDWLQLSDTDIDALVEAGCVVPQPALQFKPRPENRPQDPAFAVKLGLDTAPGDHR